MKFSFDSKEYRDNLAKEIAEKRKESMDDAKQLLKEKKETDEYVVAKDIKNVSDKIEKEMEKTGVEPEMEEIDRRNIDDKYEIQIFDISRVIPKNVRLYFDRLRLQKIKVENEDSPIKGDYRITGLVSWRPFNDSRAKVGINKVWAEINKRTNGRLSEEYERILDKYYRYLSRIKQEGQNFINEITDGAYYNTQMLTHIVEGEGQDKRLKSEKRLPHTEEKNIFQEKKFDTRNVSISGLWFGAADSVADAWYEPEKVIVICNPKNKRFEEIVRGVWTYDDHTPSEWKNLSVPELLDSATRYALRTSRSGIYVAFNKNRTWEEIADWIVDLWHGRLYRIAQKTEKTLPNTKRIDTLSISKLQENMEQEQGLPTSDDLILCPAANNNLSEIEYREKLISQMEKRAIDLK